MKYQVSQSREFDGKVRTISRRDARKLVAKIDHVPGHLLDQLDSGQRQLVDLKGWGWIRTEPRSRVRGMPALRKNWWNEGINEARELLGRLQVKAYRAGYEEKAAVLGELRKKLEELKK